MADHLVLKGSTWHVRLDIPKDIRAAFGNRRILSKSLKTGEKLLARQKAFALVSQWQAEFRAIRENKENLGDEWKEALHTIGKERMAFRGTVAQRIYTPSQGERGPIDLAPWLTEMQAIHKEMIENGYTAEAKLISNYLLKYIDAFMNRMTAEQALALSNEWISMLIELEVAATGEEYMLSQDELAEANAIITNPTIYKPKSPITKKHLSDFRTFIEKQGMKAKTVDVMISRVEQFSVYLTQTGKPITFDTVSTYLDQLTGPNERPLTSKTKKQHIWAGNTFWKWASKYSSEWRETYKNQPSPFKDHDLPVIKGESISWAVFSKSEVEALHGKALEKGDKPLADLIALAAYTGCRLEEIGRIHRNNITFSENVPTSFFVSASKTNAGIREVPIHPAIIPLILRLLESSPDGYLLKGGNNKYGNRLDAAGKRFGRLKIAADFSDEYVFHSIRKTAITLVHQAGGDIAVMPALFGHETGLITLDIYSNGPSLEQKARMISLLSYDFQLAKSQ